MIEDFLKDIEAVLKAVEVYQTTSVGGDFEKKGLETRWPDLSKAFRAIQNIRVELEKINDPKL